MKPYLRYAKRIEIIDKQLFKDTRNETEGDFLIEILKTVENLQEIGLISEKIPKNNLRLKSFQKKVRDISPNIVFLKHREYVSRGKNHDRFLIVDKNKYSIMFSTSFNNFYLNSEKNEFVSKAGFEIVFKKGRKFY